MEWVIATGNPGKLTELRALLGDLGVTLRPQSDFAVPECDEAGLSFVENAILKARNAALHSGLPALADDSGLEVDALGGAPGIRSSRFAEPDASDSNNLHKLLQLLNDVPEGQRAARFQSVVVYLRCADDASPLIAQGTWEGQIAAAPQGANGFGYDPIFLLPELGRTAAELAAAEKNRLSHRGLALARLKESLIEIVR